jgi:hypothetical protein
MGGAGWVVSVGGQLNYRRISFLKIPNRKKQILVPRDVEPRQSLTGPAALWETRGP